MAATFASSPRPSVPSKAGRGPSDFRCTTLDGRSSKLWPPASFSRFRGNDDCNVMDSWTMRRSSRPMFSSSRLRLPVTRIAHHGVDHGDLLDREIGDDLDAILVHDQHLLDAHAPLMRLAVLGLERKHHPFLDLDRMVERPDARDDRRVVLS